MAARELTPKEQQFAKAVASGSSQCEAYSRVYSADASRATKRANGHNISKRPRVAKEIKRLRRLLPVDDYSGIKAKMIEQLLEIAANDRNSVAQHRAIVTLIKYADEGAARQVTKDPQPDIGALVKELAADVEVQASLNRAEEVEPLADGDLWETLPLQTREPHVEADRSFVLGKPEQTRPMDPSHAAAEAKAEVFRATGEVETRAHEESVRSSRLEVRRLTAIYREQQHATVEGVVSEESGDFSIDRSARTAMPEVYSQASGPRPGYRREAIPGRFPSQYRWVPAFEGDEP